MKRNINIENNQLNRNNDERIGKAPNTNVYNVCLSSNRNFQESKQKDDGNNMDQNVLDLDSYLKIVYQSYQAQHHQEFQSLDKENRPIIKSSSKILAETERMKLLKIACTNEMVKHISIENAAFILHLSRGHRFEPHNLKTIAHFCSENHTEIIKSKAFMDHFGENPGGFKLLYSKILEADKTLKLNEAFKQLLIN